MELANLQPSQGMGLGWTLARERMASGWAMRASPLAWQGAQPVVERFCCTPPRQALNHPRIVTGHQRWATPHSRLGLCGSVRRMPMMLCLCAAGSDTAFSHVRRAASIATRNKEVLKVVKQARSFDRARVMRGPVDWTRHPQKVQLFNSTVPDNLLHCFRSRNTRFYLPTQRAQPRCDNTHATGRAAGAWRHTQLPTVHHKLTGPLTAHAGRQIADSRERGPPARCWSLYTC